MPEKSRLAPATTVEARENQLISLAMDLAEKQIREGTVSAQVLSQIMRWGSIRERMERDMLAQQIELAAAKTDSIHSAQRSDELYQEAVKAVRRYNGEFDEDGYEE